MFHALASPYRERSHFDGQDVLENGALKAHALQSGWLNRALTQLPGRAPREAGVALGQNVPLVMRGPAQVTSWSPSKMSALDEDTLARLTDLYANDKLLSVRLADAHRRRRPGRRRGRHAGDDPRRRCAAGTGCGPADGAGRQRALRAVGAGRGGLPAPGSRVRA